MRLRTLPVSVAGVLMAITWNAVNNNFNAVPAVICLCFAVLAQIASNFANEYFDYKAGRDRPGREGPRSHEKSHLHHSWTGRVPGS